MLTAIILLAGPAAYAVSLLLWHILRRHLLAKNSGVLDVPLLRNSRRNDRKIAGRAVICGGSIAGLLAARVCHDHFECVLIVEAEAWLASEEGRKMDGWNQNTQRSRIVQYTSLHACQCFLFDGLTKLFPGLEEECRRSDIAVLPSEPRLTLSGVRIRTPWSAFKSGLPKTMYLTRAGYETLLRRLVLDRGTYPNIEFMTGTVTDVRADPIDPSRLSKVLVRTESGMQEFEAALVADCTGTARAGMKWLERNGYGYSATYLAGKMPLDKLKISIDQKLRYTSMLFRITPAFHDRLPFPAHLKDVKSVYTFLEDDLDKGRGFFVLTRPDGNQFMAFAGHHGGDIRPQPRTLSEMKLYAQKLTTVEAIPGWVFGIMDMLEELEDSATVSILKVAPTAHIRYHQGTNLPSNWIALGDSAMTLNPLFGEGCTKAFRCALVLHKVLRQALTTSGNTLPSDFSTKFFAEQFDKTDWSWQNTRLMDYGIPTTEPAQGENLSAGAYLRWYVTKLQRLAITDNDAAWVMYNLIGSLGSPIDAFYPRLVLKILWRACVG
ncbi:hypothetical protein B0H10DRAFT_1923651 [Mycena sp. CBHHK59/15]|nr:hypothetical protein B0H10DRAFT_1923651 [Mycena sp. CBHHK59/15]